VCRPEGPIGGSRGGSGTGRTPRRAFTGTSVRTTVSGFDAEVGRDGLLQVLELGVEVPFEEPLDARDAAVDRAVFSPVTSNSSTTLIGRARFSGSAMNAQTSSRGASNSNVRSTLAAMSGLRRRDE